ncbi:MAG: hypothetical protein H7326_11015 [Bdellovibrionaceae bacterium]|nr:hypothetical protein [Pseudobdellovibrionaceae bacterium]
MAAFRADDRERLENWTILFGLALTAVLTILDIMSDIGEGATWLHLSGEALITLLAFVGFAFIWRRTFRLTKSIGEFRNTTATALTSRDEALAESVKWREEAAVAVRGMSDAIDLQLNRWNLTAAEKEVALLLMKGLSLREAAEVRGVSEKTARAQSFAVYAKSGLSGRAELSAFFLEDIMLPTEISTKDH